MWKRPCTRREPARSETAASSHRLVKILEICGAIRDIIYGPCSEESLLDIQLIKFAAKLPVDLAEGLDTRRMEMDLLQNGSTYKK